MLIAILSLTLGVLLLYFGGETLVSSSIRMARRFGISPLVIGLTVVAFATSAPELAATLTASLKGSPDIAVGNAFGSNIANLGLILGLAALLGPLATQLRFLRREVGFMVFATVVVYPLMVDGTLGRLAGAGLLVFLGVFLWNLLRDPEVPPELAADEVEPWPLWRSSLGVVLGIGLLVGGAELLVDGATYVALHFGVPERVIGLSLVALGTSLPELAAALAAARRGEADLVLGNVVGSNVFNLLCILGITSMVTPLPVNPTAMGLDYWLMLGLTLLAALMMAIGKSVRRIEGAVLLAIYFGYVVFLYLA